MPSAAKVYSARLSAAVCHAREAWELRLEQLEVDGIPKGITHVQLHWRRKAYSTKPEYVTGIAEVVTSEGNLTGTARWEGALIKQQASIGISSGFKPIPKYYELIVKGTNGQAERGSFRTLGHLTIDVAQFCTDIPQHGIVPAALELPVKPSGSLRVAISASRVHDPATVRRLHSNMSLDSHMSELSETLEDFKVEHLQGDASELERRCKSEATLEYSNDTSTMCLDKVDELEQSQKHRSVSLDPDEVAFYLRALASDDSDDEEASWRAAGAFRWLRRGQGKRSKEHQSRLKRLPQANNETSRPPHQVLYPQQNAALAGAVKIANAGPAASAIDLEALSKTDDPEALQRKLRQLMDERNELAYRNWALQATNMLVQAELDASAEKLDRAAKRVEKAERREKAALGQAEQLKALLAALAEDSYRTGQAANIRRSSYQTDELREALVHHKFKLAEAEFELLGLRQQLRVYRRGTSDSVGSSNNSMTCIDEHSSPSSSSSVSTSPTTSKEPRPKKIVRFAE